MANASKHLQPSSKSGNDRKYQGTLVASPAKDISPKCANRIVPSKQLILGGDSIGHLASILIKVVALEAVRRVSKARYPFIWNSVQALQILVYPPFSWIQRWAPLKFLVQGIQKLSMPLLFLSVTTTVSELSSKRDDEPDNNTEHSETNELASTSGTSDAADGTKEIVQENWLVLLFRELEKQGITLPERKVATISLMPFIPVSQIDHGVVNLTNKEDSRITVLLDCHGISPFRFPMQMMRSFVTVAQENYPNRLGVLFVVRLPPVVRVIAQTFLQVLKPSTKQKLRFEGDSYKKTLAEFLQAVPAFLGGKCSCPRCEKPRNSSVVQAGEGSKNQARLVSVDGGSPVVDFDFDEEEIPSPYSCENAIRAAIICLLMVCIFIAFLAGMNDPASVPPSA
ncbi:SEC14 cytosolic factor family protein / phosphoglyceride transfer family protein [Zea mays]|uniref:SEC14 cytosolic factor family protein / phosphoglyceride transfer family protein n=2 Tax=Zea mays TaxID=4577 RepID=A0A1D6GE52_MAIZE|nr:SEC14 cytosolic factor family protein / phosphoglyceride transfer family protein [Zea mays]